MTMEGDGIIFDPYIEYAEKNNYRIQLGKCLTNLSLREKA